jgi:hypothetical protein
VASPSDLKPLLLPATIFSAGVKAFYEYARKRSQ